jgi:hypothetical protein
VALLCVLAACDSAPLAPVEAAGEVYRIETRQPGGGSLDGVDPASVQLEIGSEVQLVAVNAAGEPVSVSWSSSDHAVASIVASGLLTARGAGVAVITAHSRNHRATASVSVVGTAWSPAQACTDLPHQRLVDVSSAAQLGTALANARAGDLIRLAAGSYTGRWSTGASGTAEHPISLCGPREAVLSDTRYDAGAVLRLSGARYWVVHGFTIRTALWGVRLEGSSDNRLQELHIHDIGQEAIRLRQNSSRNVVQGVRIHDTGRRGGSYREWGEGIYVGSWSGHWEGRQPDRSDHNRILDSHFGPNVTAEHIDVKEGTTGTVIRGNRFDGRGMENDGDRIDSWVLVQGNDGLVENNVGVVARTNGFRVWPGHDGSWGQRNVFRGNSADVRADGYGFAVQGRDNIISCANTVTGAGSGFSNVGCSN